jgi:hypothetical protein
MSELAFNLNGEPFELPAAAVGWRVRRIKGRGAPEVVYSREGIPLMLPIDADIDDLRDAARSEGRFRLDPVDEHNRMISQTPAGYVCVPPVESGPELAPLASRTTSDSVAIEAMRMNTELARTIIDKFPMMMDSAAALLRAADGAGLPAREPRAVVANDERSDRDDDDSDDDDDRDEDDEDDDVPEAPAPKATGLAAMLETLVPLVMPVVMSAIAGGQLKLPDGLAALLNCRRASPTARTQAAAAATHATRPPGAVPAPGPHDPAPASRGTRASGFAPAHAPASGRTNGTATASPSAPVSDAPRAAGQSPSQGHEAVRHEGVTVHGPDPVSATIDVPHVHAAQHADPALAELGAAAPRSPGVPWSERSAQSGAAFARAMPADVVPGAAAHPGGSTLATGDDTATEPAEELPTLDAVALAHFAAIQGALTFREGMMARALAAELSPADLRTWLSELRELSVPEAVARIRGVLEAGGDDGASGGAS